MKFVLLGIQFTIGRPRFAVCVDDPSLKAMTRADYAKCIPIIERGRDGKISHDHRGVYDQVCRCPGLRKSRVFCSTPEVMN